MGRVEEAKASEKDEQGIEEETRRDSRGEVK